MCIRDSSRTDVLIAGVCLAQRCSGGSCLLYTSQPGLKAFTAAVLGGIGNVPGAMLGGLFLGLFESVGPSLFLQGLKIPAAYQLKDAIAFTMLVLILIFRPTGILGERLGAKRA